MTFRALVHTYVDHRRHLKVQALHHLGTGVHREEGHSAPSRKDCWLQIVLGSSPHSAMHKPCGLGLSVASSSHLPLGVGVEVLMGCGMEGTGLELGSGVFGNWVLVRSLSPEHPWLWSHPDLGARPDPLSHKPNARKTNAIPKARKAYVAFTWTFGFIA